MSYEQDKKVSSEYLVPFFCSLNIEIDIPIKILTFLCLELHMTFALRGIIGVCKAIQIVC